MVVLLSPMTRSAHLTVTSHEALGLWKPAAIHVCFIFDQGRYDFTMATLRSILHTATTPLVFHLVAPLNLHDEIHNTLQDQQDSPDVSLQLYDIQICQVTTTYLQFMAPTIHKSPLCKVFLADILPENVTRVLYLDADLVVTNDLQLCTPEFEQEQLIGMGVDMGESCQHDPDLCFPIGFETTVPDHLECATVPYRSHYIKEHNLTCRSSGELETYQYNGGVMWMDLNKMRLRGFTTLFVLASYQTYFKLNRKARWGEQDMMNNLFRFHPELLLDLGCGCNYQFSGPRRESKCYNEKVVIGHGWSGPMNDGHSKNKYKLYFDHFRYQHYLNARAKVPDLPKLAPPSPDWRGSMPQPRHSELCRLQSHNCTLQDHEQLVQLRGQFLRPNLPISQSLTFPPLFILTRTSNRPVFFRELVDSVIEQSYPNIRHVVLTDDRKSLNYIQHADQVLLVPSQSPDFDANQVCEQCGHLSRSTQNCAAAPYEPHARQQFFDCYCNTNYPMNDYMNDLIKAVEQSGGGWMMILDDDNLLQTPHSVMELMSRVMLRNNTDTLFAFRSTLGRVTPHDTNFRDRKIVMGDFDSSNFVYHSSQNIPWPRTRCGDFKTGYALSQKVRHMDWFDQSIIQSNPLRDAIGGLGQRNDARQQGVTVILTSYQTTGWRPVWVREIIEYYLSPTMESLIAKVILVWNNVDEPVPAAIPNPSDYLDGRLVVLKNPINSLNNRWVNTLPHINPGGVILNLDDDLYVSREGLICMLNWYKREPQRMVAPFVRRIKDNGDYVLDELLDGSPYSVALPRILLIPVSYLESYASEPSRILRDYVDDQSAHCDDIVMNVVAQKASKKPPLRVMLPDETVVDFFSRCWAESKDMTGGLALQGNRAQRRSECIKEIMKLSDLSAFKSSTDVATCLPRGNALMKRSENFVKGEFERMAIKNIVCHTMSSEAPSRKWIGSSLYKVMKDTFFDW